MNGIWADVALDSRNRVVVGGELGLFETADLSAGRYVDVATPAADTTAPVITNARVSPRTWAVKAGGRSEIPVASSVKRGTSFIYTLSETARVTIRIERRRPKGRGSGAKKFAGVGTFAAAGAPARTAGGSRAGSARSG